MTPRETIEPELQAERSTTKVEGLGPRPKPLANKLRVLFLMTRDVRHPGLAGGDLGMWERATYLAREGHMVCVVTSRFPGGARVEKIDGVNVVRLSGIYSLWWRTFVYYMRRCRGRYDAVVTEGFGGSRVPRFAPLYVTEPVITEWHQIHRDLFAVQYPRWVVPALNALERLTAFVHRDTMLVVRTEEWKQAFPQLGFKPSNIRVVPACIDESWLIGSRPGAVASPQVICIGKIRRYKCPDHVIRAMHLVLRAVPTARLMVVGRHDDLAYERELRSLVEKLEIGPHVQFHFGIPEADKRALLRQSRIMALPSAVEGFGIVVLEANASGVPVIASSGVPESVVESGRNGLRFAFGDIQALAASIVSVLSDDALYAELSAGSLAFARSLTWAQVCSQYESIVRSIVDRPLMALTPASSGTPQR
jgi:glycosyltransferase involved in cell wall biosynthesis